MRHTFYCAFAQCLLGDTMKKTKYHARALGIIIVLSILLPILYGAISYGQIYVHNGSISVASNHTNPSNSSSLGEHKANPRATNNNLDNSSNDLQLLNYTGINASIISAGASDANNKGGSNPSAQTGPSSAPSMPRPILLNKTIFLQNAVVASESIYMRGSNYLVLKTVSIAYSNYTFNISQASYIKLKVEASQKDSGVIMLNEPLPSDALANSSQQVLEINGTNATISGIYQPGRLKLSVGNMNTTSRIAVQIELNITPVVQ